MGLWRRSFQGRLSEVLGGNFIERDSMTRRSSSAATATASGRVRVGHKGHCEAFTRGHQRLGQSGARAVPEESSRWLGAGVLRSEDLLTLERTPLWRAATRSTKCSDAQC